MCQDWYPMAKIFDHRSTLVTSLVASAIYKNRLTDIKRFQLYIQQMVEVKQLKPHERVKYNGTLYQDSIGNQPVLYFITIVSL